MWKPGQIVTICSKRYRIKKNLDRNGTCSKCVGHGFFMTTEPCRTCLNSWKMPYNHYLEEIEPKSVMGQVRTRIDNYQNERKCCNNRTSSRTS